MNKSFVAVLGTLLLGLALIQAVAQSATDNPTAKSSKAKGVKQMPFRGKIVSVDAPAKTITLSGKEKNRVFLVSDAAKIRKEHANRPGVAAVAVDQANRTLPSSHQADATEPRALANAVTRAGCPARIVASGPAVPALPKANTEKGGGCVGYRQFLQDS